MKKVFLVSALTAVSLVLVGCSQKAPETAQAEALGTSSSSSSSLQFVQFGSVKFDFDKFDIRKSEQAVMENNIRLAKVSSVDVTIEGNCDEFGTDEYNYALGLKRAQAVKKAMTTAGIAEARLKVVSFGEANPVCQDKTSQCRAQNRRVDFK